MNRYLKYILIATILTFVGISGVKAAGPTCVYSDSTVNPSWRLTCTVENVDATPTCSVSGDNYEYEEQHLGLTATDFINSNNTWGCKKTLYAYKNEYLKWFKKTYQIYSVRDESSGGSLEIEVHLIDNESSYGDSVGDDNIKRCKYDDIYGTEIILNHTTQTVTISNTLCKSFTGGIDLDYSYAAINKLAMEDGENDCPSQLYFTDLGGGQCYLAKKHYPGYYGISHDNNGEIEGADGKDIVDHGGKTPSPAKVDFDCSNAGETISLIRQIYNLLRFLIPVLIVGLSIVDFVKVLLNGEEKVFKDAWIKFAKRVAIGVVILILPILLSSLLKLSGALNDYGISSSEYFCIFK